MSGGHFSVGTFQIGTKLSDPILEIFVQTGLFWGEFVVMELIEISVFSRNGTSARSFEMIQTFADCDLAEPGFFVGTVKTGEIFVSGKKNILGQILSIKRIAYRFQTDRIY